MLGGARTEPRGGAHTPPRALGAGSAQAWWPGRGLGRTDVAPDEVETFAANASMQWSDQPEEASGCYAFPASPGSRPPSPRRTRSAARARRWSATRRGASSIPL
jgi:hypothetical protein